MSPQEKRIELFRQKRFPHVKHHQWNSWKWQLQNSLSTADELSSFYQDSCYNPQIFEKAKQRFPITITPFYLALINSTILEKTVLPHYSENSFGPLELRDPLLEQKDSPLPNLIHRYPDRVLFLTTQNCAVYCRYCTRSRLVGNNKNSVNDESWKENILYIKKHKKIREVILSGGDPLFLEDNKLELLLGELRKINHVQIIRISSKIPVVMPQRITEKLVSILRKFHPLYLSLHIIHAEELNKFSKNAIDLLIDAGLVIASQTVLLKGVNDSSGAIKELMEKLLLYRVRPYALYQCDLVEGSMKFRTPISLGLEIIEYLRENSSGYALPQFIVDPPGGKVALSPQVMVGRNSLGYSFKNWQGKTVFYPEANCETELQKSEVAILDSNGT